MSEKELEGYHEDRKLIEFRLHRMEDAITKLADTVTSYINSNDKVTTELKVKVGIASAVVAAVVSAAVKLLWK